MANKECEGVIQVILCDIKVSGSLHKGDYHLVIGELEMKDKYSKYKGHMLDDNTTVTPLINLDLYGQTKGDGDIIRIDKVGFKVNVSIPIDLITSKTKVKDINNFELYFYDWLVK